MGAVLRLVRYSNRETLEVCSAMHERSARGEVTGVALYFRDRSGEDHCVFTGPFEANLAEAASAAMRMSRLVAQMQGDLM